MESTVLRTHEEYAAFVRSVEPNLRRAFAGSLGVDRAEEALSETFVWGWENWARLSEMANPVGFLFRVGQSKTRPRKKPALPRPELGRIPQIEPALVDCLRELTEMQRSCVWLVHACGWTHAEVGDALQIGSSTVATHVSRALERLRAQLGEVSDA